MKPVLFVTNQVPPDRVGASRRWTSARTSSSPSSAGARTTRPPGSTTRTSPSAGVGQRDVAALAAERPIARRRLRDGRAASRCRPPTSEPAERGMPFILWSALWAAPAHARAFAGCPLLRRLYRRADAVVTYGPHVSRLRSRARRLQRPRRAPGGRQRFWSIRRSPPSLAPAFVALFVGRAVREKGIDGACAPAWAPPVLGDGEPIRSGRSSAVSRRSRSSCATSMPPRTFSSCRPSPPELSRALGVRRQRSHEPGTSRHRQRRGRRRRRRPGAPRAQRPRRPAGDADALAAALRRCRRCRSARPAWRRRLRETWPPTRSPHGSRVRRRPALRDRPGA